MGVKFKQKSKEINYKLLKSYKLYQLLTLLKIFKTLKLSKISLILYLLDNDLELNDLNKSEILSFSNYLPIKIIEFSLNNDLIIFKRKSFKLSEKGELFYKKLEKEKIFSEVVLKVKKYKQHNKIINDYIKEMGD
ncbi:MAG: hypothetical protein Q7K48_06150 [Fusobacterium sp. JB021]|nr:hypothetical protein [Fusobacterium sp. JB021]